MKPSALCVAAYSLVVLAGCADAPSTDGLESGGRMGVVVAPITLSGVTNACYTLSVTNGLGQEVWTRW